MKKLCYLIVGLVLTTSLVFVMSGCHIETDSYEHTFAANYSKDETYHWYAATCEHTTEVKGMLVHNFGEWKIILDPIRGV